MPNTKNPRTLACAETDVSYPFKELAVNAIKALIPFAEDDSAPASEAAKKAIEAIDVLATIVNKAYINANETAQDLDIQTKMGNPADLSVCLNIFCCLQQAMERDLQTRHHSEVASYLRSITMEYDPSVEARLVKYFHIKEGSK
jgi:hypothetical protein